MSRLLGIALLLFIGGMMLIGGLIEAVKSYPLGILAVVAVLVIMGFLFHLYEQGETKRKEEEFKRQQEEALALQIAADENRKNYILSHIADWGDDACNLLIDRRICIGMLEEMVSLAWGEPGQKEFKGATSKGTKTRWIYGVPRKGARYVWFTNGKVTKIQG